MVKILLLVLISVTIQLTAQIPNGDFESWTSYGNYENPSGIWTSFNSYAAGPFYPVTKSTVNYPVGTGNYSIRIENNTAITALDPPAHAGGLGMAYWELKYREHELIKKWLPPNSAVL